MKKPPENKNDWLKLLLCTEIPSFGESIKLLSNADVYSSQHASELVRTVLKDPNLTVSALKLANSASFNRQGETVTTISRAIMVLGYKSIKEICASCLLIESFLTANSSFNMKALIVRSFHAANQAKQIALLQGQEETEEIFISTLLLSIGELAVYSAIGQNESLSTQLVESYPLQPGHEKKIIGCYFNDLTVGLCDAWHIAPMIKQMLGGHYAEDSPVRSILLASSFAVAYENSGLESAFNRHVKTLVRYTAKSSEEVSDKMLKAIEETRSSLKNLGLKLEEYHERTVANKVSLEPFEIKVDKMFQLEFLLKLSKVEHKKLEVNSVIQQLLSGIKKGGGFSCAVVALLSPEQTVLTNQYILQETDRDIKQKFNFDCSLDIPEIYHKVIINREIICRTELRKLGITMKQLDIQIGNTNSIWGPLCVDNKVIGCFYADNGLNAPAFTQEQIDAFTLMVGQARLLLQKPK